MPGYDSRVDVWSAGVVGYEVLTGRAPFSASSPAKIIQVSGGWLVRAAYGTHEAVKQGCLPRLTPANLTRTWPE